MVCGMWDCELFRIVASHHWAVTQNNNETSKVKQNIVHKSEQIYFIELGSDRELVAD